MEILPGIHRIESDLGARFMCQYLLTGEDHTVLVDTGLAGTPEEVIIPYLEGIGLTLGDIDEVIISYADVDHCGGNRAAEGEAPLPVVFVRRAGRAGSRTTSSCSLISTAGTSPTASALTRTRWSGYARSWAATPR